MRVVLINGFFAERMGYAENMLPPALARLGAEVHVVTATRLWEFAGYTRATSEVYRSPDEPAGVRRLDGFWLHRLPYETRRHGPYLKGLYDTLRRIRPHVVQLFAVAYMPTYQALMMKPLLGYKLFLGTHLHRSVFFPKKGLFPWRPLVGRIAGALSERCYSISTDASWIMDTWFRFPRRKLRLAPLGTDAELFRPDDARREATRRRLGFAPDDIVCVYSGRFSSDKNPHVLARAVERLPSNFRALFIGGGTREEEDALRARGCVVHPYVAVTELPDLYRAADIGVWPKQESTSQIDAAACGLPLILSDRVEVRERIDGCGLTYRQDDEADLAAQIRRLADPELRRRWGAIASTRMREQFNWERIARERLSDYRRSVA